MAVPERANLPCESGKSSKIDKKLLVVSQEIKFARCLAGNNRKIRDRALKNLKKWFENRAITVPFTEDDFMRIWKGLFYSMWMSDKPLIQEECAENISNLLHSLPTDSALLFYKAGLMILINEWFGIDQLRLDKFLMLVRRLLRQAFVVLKNANFQRSSIRQFSKHLNETLLKTNATNTPIGLLMHFIDIYLEELAKIGGDTLNQQQLPEFLIPFIQYMALCNDDRLLRHINENIFIYLMKQSDLGLEYQEKYNVWRQQRFRGTLDDIEKIEIDNDDNNDDDDRIDDEEEKVYDPRAGRVDVDLPQLKFDPKIIAEKLTQYKFVDGSTLKTRKTITRLIDLFEKLSMGVYPIGCKRLRSNREDYDTNINNAARRLMDFVDGIMDKKPPEQQQEQQQQRQNGDVFEKKKKNKKRKIEQEINDKPKNQLTIDKKLKKQMTEAIKNSIINQINNFDKIESIFARNSGIWVVTNETPQTDTINNNKQQNFRNKIEQNQSIKTIDNKTNKTATLMKINKKAHNTRLHRIESKKKLKKLAARHLLQNIDTKLVNNLITTPTKKVKINTRLNTSQDVSEHHAQIMSSPAIPYDASKRPSKPLLKTTPATTPVNSPINPFYNCL